MGNKVEITGVNTSTLPKLNGKQMAELMVKIKNGDKDAREEFAYANMRLVLSVVQRFNTPKENVDDIFQVGCIGLMKAIDNFDTGLNVKFSTYAVPMIIGEIKRFLRDNNSIRVSRSLRDIAYRALKAREILSKDKVEEPTIEEISQLIDVKVKDVAIALDAISAPVSLGNPVFNDGDDTKNSEEIWLENINLKDALTKLNPREKEILLLRYYIGKTQMEVSEEVGISQAQVSRLEKTAIDQIKKCF